MNTTTIPQVGETITYKGTEFRVVKTEDSDWMATRVDVWVVKADGSSTRRTRIHFYTK